MTETMWTDIDISNASRGALDVASILIERTSITQELYGQMASARERHADIILSLDPSKILEEYNRIFPIAMKISASEGPKAELKVTEGLLENWQGAAKDEFLRQLSRTESFLDQQGEACWEVVRALTALFALTFHSRNSYHELCMNTRFAVEETLGNQEKKELETKIAVGTRIVSMVISFSPESLKQEIATTITDTAGEMAKLVFGGEDANGVVGKYIQGGDDLVREYEAGLSVLQSKISAHQATLEQQRPQLLEPLSPKIDVDSPDFSYANFSSEHTPPPNVEGQVDQGRKAHATEEQAQEQQTHDRNIGKRLDGSW